MLSRNMTRSAERSSSSGLGDLERIVGQLIDEPLLHVSLGSKELFHCNLLGWMCERFPQRARRVLAPWLRPDRHAVTDRVRREYRHLDLVIEFAGYAPLVIENKMFALPDEGQLDRYSATVTGDVGATP